jgi:hypothetical protein
MSDTPDTDALWHEMNTGNYQPSWWFVAERMRDHAKKMELERNEAIRQRNEINESSKYAVDYAIRERDEARKDAADAITNYTLMEAKCFRLEHHDQFKS